MVVLGIDPGIERLGYGFIRFDNGIQPLSYGLVKTTSKMSKPERLLQIYLDLKCLVEKHKPEAVSIETIIFAKNVTTALTISEARGVILLLCSQYELPVYEFTPLQIKMSVTGYGRSSKGQIERAIKMILCLPEIPKPDDVSDALAIALCGGNHIAFQNKLQGK